MNNQKLIIAFVFGVLLGLLLFYSYQEFFPSTSIAIFSPGNGEKIISLLDSAESSIDLEVYVFTSQEIIDSLKNAYDKGVYVRVILEKRFQGATNQDAYKQLMDHGIEVKWSSYDYKLMHTKFAVIDKKKVLVGSHNFSNSALNLNREASVILESPLVKEFIEIFETDWKIAF